jgi:hypothetical protein
MYRQRSTLNRGSRGAWVGGLGDMATLVEFVFSRSTRRFCRVLIRADISAMSWLEAMVRVATMRKTANAQTRGGSTW